MKQDLKAKTIIIILIGVLVGLISAGPWVNAQMSPGTMNARQTGTWTVQPGNTANSTAWLVTGTGGTFPVTGTFWQSTQPVSIATMPSTPVTGTFYQATQPVSIAGTVATAPGALTTLTTGQQAVTGTAAVLPTVTASRICLRVLIAGTQTVYFGPSGVTTATGQELSPGDTWCGTLSNLNSIYVIASTTGSTIGYEVEH
jgi:hypothetical protein